MAPKRTIHPIESKKMMKQLSSRLTFYFFMVAALSLQGCSGSGRLGKAMKTYEVGEYARATSALNKAYRREDNRYYRGEASFYMGESYRHTNQPRRAAPMYARALRFNYKPSESLLLQARQMLKLEQYEDAAALFESYLQESNHQLAHNGLASARLGQNPPPPKAYQLETIRKLTSRNSDFSPFLNPDDPTELFFSSMRTTGKKKRHQNRITGQGFSSIYSVIQDSRGDWQDPVLFLDQESDGDYEDGTLTLTADGRNAYFTRTRYDKGQPMGAEIWNTQSMGGRWSDPVKIELGPDSLIFAHPAISPDGKTLYFVSDMPGGFGGKDLWMVPRIGDEWGTPVNLGGDINTAGDELFPTVRQDGTLYFSSDGLVGYGGLDIFKATPREEDGRWRVENLGRPINSSSDDFGITFYRNREAGFFSSSRDNPRGYENIYAFALPVIRPLLGGKVRTADEEVLPEGAMLRIVGTDGSNRQVPIGSGGNLNLMLEPDQEYTLLVRAPGYLNHHQRISTTGLTESKTFELDIQLQSASAPIVFNQLQFKPGQSDLSPEAQKELDRVADMMNTNPALKIHIDAHTDARGEATAQLVLAQQRAEAVMNYLQTKGVAEERLSARGHGGSTPLKVDAVQARIHRFLKEGDELTEDFLQRLSRGDQNTARALNNRVEFSIMP